MRLATIAALLAAPLAAATSGVEGSVSNSVNGAPVRKVVVTLRTANYHSAYQALTDAAGHFQFDDVPAGDYQVSAEAQGFVREPRAFIASHRVVLAAEQRVRDVSVRITPLATISGRVHDENGEPVAGADVYAVRQRFRSTGKDLINGEAATTNYRGEYRLFDVEPGPWLLKVRKRVTPPAATGEVHGALPEMDYVTAYHPGVRNTADAETIFAAPGAQLTGIDLRLQKVRVFHVRGKIAGPTPARIHDLDDSWSVQVKSDGTFDIAGFPAGRYRLGAEAGGALSTVHEVTIESRDVDGLILRIEPAPGITGTVEGVPAGAENIRVNLEPVAGMAANRNIPVSTAGAFALAGVPAQPFRVSARTPEGLYLKSVHYGPLDVSGTAIIDVAPGVPLVLTFAADPGVVDGTVTSAAPADLPTWVTIAPTGAFEGRLDRIQSLLLDDPAGAFELADIPPGDYRIFACETFFADLPESPEFRKLFEGRSESVMVRPGEHQSVRIKVIPAADVEDARRKLR
jgi:Carboxypeptidase regulatory-like domain